MNKLLSNAALSLGLLVGFPGLAVSAPFDTCPSKAFLIQENVAKLYGADLSTGYVELLSDNLGTTGKVNALGFSYGDGYLYGWSYEHRTLAKIGSDFQLQPITLVNPLNDNYYVGDVSVDGTVYVIYKRGSGGSHGLWRIDLDPVSQTYLDPQRVVDGKSLQLAIYDIAFHPFDGQLYSVTSSGGLVRIDPATGTSTALGSLGEKGTFGAVYFDVEGRLYMSRNADGAVFQVNIGDVNPAAVWYAQGPKSSNNDGARCALASVAPQETSLIDFGDAPDSYGTTLVRNGARHNLEGSAVYLGDSVDSEVQANVSPGSDDSARDDDEDGIVFITDIAAGEVALVAISSVGSGFLNAWIDFDGDGEFLESEQVIDTHPVSGGSEIMSLQIPQNIVSGASWSRFRVSSTRNIGPTGGAADGEVEDHPVELFGRRVTASHFPSASGYVTLAYEDLWPRVGDYDMNDLVMYYRTTINTASIDNKPEEQYLHSISINGQVSAVGAALHSGFGVEMTGLPRSSIDQSGMSLVINGVQRPGTFLEQGAGYENAVFIVFNDVWNHVSAAEGCKFYRTEDLCGGSAIQSQFTLTVPVIGNIPAQVIDDPILNPFIFGSNARRKEIHLKNKPPTSKADMSALGSADDSSNPDAGVYYQTSRGLPWAMVVGTEWIHPEEARDLVQTYPKFKAYVTSDGKGNTKWYEQKNAVLNNLYQD